MAALVGLSSTGPVAGGLFAAAQSAATSAGASSGCACARSAASSARIVALRGPGEAQSTATGCLN